ncbi:MAG: type II toxin-antitoxin system YafQ family toxin [candidate division KSB1 bacterium]|nr:type II toxin-antitoxin system YafQ family toxin [candidate division KSB1 bacterium]MDZ7363843.1 type II toxin-antitoxin system YafQ family toxin [candidate division KSB1 bacterium]MDZ7369070.1 type II toxin-antitoxin system YafQ family toxin [candidate division KSB1 bacterium]
MLKPVRTKQFKKDYKKALRQGKDIEKLDMIMLRLAAQEKLERKHNDHKLVGNFKGRRECHIEPDWLLVYSIQNDLIIFERTGSHSDLFI